MFVPASLVARLDPGTPAGTRVCEIIDGLRDFLAKQAVDNDRAGRFAQESMARLTDAGVLAACVPVELGGFGVEALTDLAVITARLAESDASVATAAYMHLALSWYYARGVRHDPYADPRRTEWLRAIGGREMLVCSSVAEPGVTAWNLTSEAVRRNDTWVINGRKVLASNSPSATHFYTRVKASTPDGPMQGSVMIPLAAKGVEVRDNWDGLGLRGSGSGEVIFSEVALPVDAISMRGRWGERDGSGLEGRVANAIPLLGVPMGIAEAARGVALASLTGTSGRKRTGSVGTGSLLADLEVSIAAARGALHTALAHIDAAITPTAPRSMCAEAGKELMRECVAAGMIVERAAVDVVDIAMQICGGRSYAGDHPLGRMCRDVRATMFMRPWAPAEEWPDFLATAAIEEAGRQ